MSKPKSTAAATGSLGTQLALAGISNAAAAACTNPIDVTKVRLQLHGEGARGAARSVVSTFTHILQAEGAAGLYRGLSASLVMKGCCSACSAVGRSSG